MPDPVDLERARTVRDTLSREERAGLLVRDLDRVLKRVRELRVKSLVVVLVDYDGDVATNLVADYFDLTLLLGALEIASSDLLDRLRRDRVDSGGDLPDSPGDNHA